MVKVTSHIRFVLNGTRHKLYPILVCVFLIVCGCSWCCCSVLGPLFSDARMFLCPFVAWWVQVVLSLRDCVFWVMFVVGCLLLVRVGMLLVAACWLLVLCVVCSLCVACYL